MRSYAYALIVSLLPPLPVIAQHAPISGYEVPATLADGWTTATAESMGVDARKLAALRY